jgi:hypothetical protein
LIAADAAIFTFGNATVTAGAERARNDVIFGADTAEGGASMGGGRILISVKLESAAVTEAIG